MKNPKSRVKCHTAERRLRIDMPVMMIQNKKSSFIRDDMIINFIPESSVYFQNQKSFLHRRSKQVLQLIGLRGGWEKS